MPEKTHYWFQEFDKHPWSTAQPKGKMPKFVCLLCPDKAEVLPIYVLPSMPLREVGILQIDGGHPVVPKQQVFQDIDPLHFEVSLGNEPVQWLQVHYQVERPILLGY